jgi:hypothetical protein
MSLQSVNFANDYLQIIEDATTNEGLWADFTIFF